MIYDNPTYSSAIEASKENINFLFCSTDQQFDSSLCLALWETIKKGESDPNCCIKVH